MADIDRSIGHRLSSAREAVAMSQRDLATCSGVSQSTIHRIESGLRAASIAELSTLADACGVLIADLQGANAIADQVLCAGRMNDAGTQDLASYMLYAFGVARRLDEMGVAEFA
ncbi:helix-turn-helix domain-containing protein [Glutamicibacter soli]|uniref:helix-turn-helix domain-containing protein n=1 Tax=Glutamicibacter soli TaxID=453836 RepID=UPI003FD23067